MPTLVNTIRVMNAKATADQQINLKGFMVLYIVMHTIQKICLTSCTKLAFLQKKKIETYAFVRLTTIYTLSSVLGQLFFNIAFLDVVLYTIGETFSHL